MRGGRQASLFEDFGDDEQEAAVKYLEGRDDE